MKQDHPWIKLLTGVRGASEFARAIAAGDVASQELFEAERSICMVCPHRVERWGSSWCGEPFVDRTSKLIPKWLRTCGCNLAGMLRVGSKKCVQGRHDEVRAKLARLTVEGEDPAAPER